MSRGSIRIGTQGWNYPAWVGPLFPTGSRPRDFLSLYARAFDAVEVDSTFYAIPPVRTVRGWAERTPDHFRFTLKLPREITHERRLRGADHLLAEFLDHARELGPKLGPVLVQLGPDFSPAERDALRGFLPLLPPDLRFAVEFRQREWISRDTHRLLADHGVALALSDGRWTPRRWMLQLAARPTADFLYVRWMGADRRLTDFSRVQLDRSDELQAWADALAPAADLPLDVYGFFNNHFSGHSPATARELQRRLGQPPVPPDRIGEQIRLL